MREVKGLSWAQDIVKEINNSDETKYVSYRDSRPVANLKQMIGESAELFGERPAFKQRFVKGQPFGSITYKKAFADMNAIGTALIDMGLKGKRIAVIGANCYQWAVSYLAVVNGVGVVVPLDKELNDSELTQLCATAQVEAVIFQAKHEKTFLQIKESGETNISLLINMNAHSQAEEFGTSVDAAEGVFSLADIRAKGYELIAAGERSYVDAEIDNEAMSVLLFTSGTTGIAKGVMISHKNLCCDLMISTPILKVTPKDTFFSVLPLHHTYECTSGFLVPLYKGASIAYCEGLKYLQSNLKEVQPSFFLGVPLIFEKFYKNIWANIRKQGKEKQVKSIMKFCGKLGKPGLVLQRKLLSDIYAVFGPNMKDIISGGAACNTDILRFFNDLGYVALQGYGLTECAPMVSLNPDRHETLKIDSVGHIFPTLKVKVINQDENGIGEICVKGDNVMLGYYEMPKETAEVIIDGWFHTGDLGYVDNDNFVYLTGRKKNVIITANGKNVFPEELEHYLSGIPFVSESMVWADTSETGKDTTIIASIFPDENKIKEAAGKFDIETATKLIQAEVDKINNNLPLFKQIRRIIVRNEDFEKNTSHKIKRFVSGNKK